MEDGLSKAFCAAIKGYEALSIGLKELGRQPSFKRRLLRFFETKERIKSDWPIATRNEVNLVN